MNNNKLDNESARPSSELLPIYKPTLNLAGYILDLVKDTPQFLRYSYGDRMISNTVDMIELIVRANMSSDMSRLEALTEFAIRLSSLKALLIIYKERHPVSNNLEANISLLMNDIGKQCTAWRKKTKDNSQN